MTAVTTAIAQLHIRCLDLPRAIAFYHDVLDLPFLFETNGMAFFQCGGIRLLIGRAELPEIDHASSVVYFKTDDIDSAHRTLEERGAKMLQPPHRIARMADREIWLCDWHDSEGNLMAFMEERVTAAAMS